jgi:hypothetical protein
MPLGLRVVAVAEVRPKPVVRGEADVVRRRHHQIRNHRRPQTPHPVSEHNLRDTTEGFEVGQQGHRRRGFLVGGEAHEPPP